MRSTTPIDTGNHLVSKLTEVLVFERDSQFPAAAAVTSYPMFVDTDWDARRHSGCRISCVGVAEHSSSEFFRPVHSAGVMDAEFGTLSENSKNRLVAFLWRIK